MKYTIPGELTDLNTYVKNLNKSRWSGLDTKTGETDRVAWEVIKQGPTPIAEYPVHIRYDWFSKDQRKDIDNVAFAKKYINDGLVAAHVLTDDSRKYVSGFTDRFFIDKENPRVEITIISESKMLK